MISETQPEIVFHKTFDPGKVLSRSLVAVEVAFHDGRHETFKPSYATETLLPCGTEGFSARLLRDKKTVMRALAEEPREVFRWLSLDLGKEITTRSAKPLIKALGLVSADEFDSMWRQTTRHLQREAPKRRLAEADVIQIASEEEAVSAEGSLWDTDLHIASRNAIYRALAEFYEARPEDAFFLRILFSPVPAARIHAYGVLKKRGELDAIVTALTTIRIDERSAAGVLDVWFRVGADLDEPTGREYRDRVASVFLQAIACLSRSERNEQILRLLTPQGGVGFSFAVAVIGRMSDERFDELVPTLSLTSARAFLNLYVHAIVGRVGEEIGAQSLATLLSRINRAYLVDVVIDAARVIYKFERYALVRAFMNAAVPLVARIGDPEEALSRLRTFLLEHREAISDGLRHLFLSLGMPLESTATFGHEDHLRRVVDGDVPIAIRRRSLFAIKDSLSRENVSRMIVRLAPSRRSDDAVLLSDLWDTFRAVQTREDTAALLVDLILRPANESGLRAWLLSAVSASQVEGDVAQEIIRRLTAKTLDVLDSELRAAVGGLRGSTLGDWVRRQIVASRTQSPFGVGASRWMGDAFGLLGGDTELYSVLDHALTAMREKAEGLRQRIADLEATLGDVLVSQAVQDTIQERVGESLEAREAQLRQDWERGLERTRLVCAIHPNSVASTRLAESSLKR